MNQHKLTNLNDSVIHLKIYPRHFIHPWIISKLSLRYFFIRRWKLFIERKGSLVIIFLSMKDKSFRNKNLKEESIETGNTNYKYVLELLSWTSLYTPGYNNGYIYNFFPLVLQRDLDHQIQTATHPKALFQYLMAL